MEKHGLPAHNVDTGANSYAHNERCLYNDDHLFKFCFMKIPKGFYCKI